ncbi:hypothetical protein ACFFU8_09375 [Chromobacterium piscinae]|uniref:hypothetical protein n=1 Tax=Chromobacterium piscinae TaxID=686831 RepID=UPI001E2BDDF3|nr:hypothetical protein [Chromobacterium piscinae]MCD5327885.1 hypothetical protein [Chromobacterium piscinae]
MENLAYLIPSAVIFVLCWLFIDPTEKGVKGFRTIFFADIVMRLVQWITARPELVVICTILDVAGPLYIGFFVVQSRQTSRPK